MAQQLKREYNLVALKVVLRTRGDQARIGLDLEVAENHNPETVWSASFDAEEIGILPRPSASGTELSSFRFPHGVAHAIDGVLHDVGYDGPLWLHLVKPYGMLGALPWESWLADIRRPMLRIPDALAPPPDEGAPTLDVVLCASCPGDRSDFSIPRCILGIASAIFRGVDRKQRLHVFTDMECMRDTEALIASSDLPTERIFVFNAERSPPESWRGREGRAVGIANPWLAWMLDSMHGHPVDVVHFICHGYEAEGSGSLAFAHSPTANGSLDWGRFIGGGELGRFLLAMGAWSLGFSSPPSNASEFGLRLLADEFAQVRPGPVFHHHLPRDEGLENIQATYRFLYSRERSVPPPMAAVSLCCQPALLGRGQPEASMKSVTSPSLLGKAAEVQREPASWLASTQRLLEQKAFEVSRSEMDSLRLGTSSDAGVDGLKRGLSEIEEALSRLGRKGLL